MDQLGPAVHAEMGRHAEGPLVALLRLVHVRISFPQEILRRAGSSDAGGIHDGPRLIVKPCRDQILLDPRNELCAHLVGFQ